jgi:hypothetical protein
MRVIVRRFGIGGREEMFIKTDSLFKWNEAFGRKQVLVAAHA